MKKIKTSVKWILLVLFFLFQFLAAMITYWFLRPYQPRLNPKLSIKHWTIINDGAHNSCTDMTFFKGYYYLAFVSAPSHAGSHHSKVILKRSKDLSNWENTATFALPDEDIRDPKLTPVGNRLFLYVLKNKSALAQPYITIYSYSTNGTKWSLFKNILYKNFSPKGLLFWRPKTRDQKTWYVPAYKNDNSFAALLKSTDGITWEFVSHIYNLPGIDETSIEFMKNGDLIGTIRMEVFADSPLGNNNSGTIIFHSKPPYQKYNYSKDKMTRLDGPVLFRIQDKVYASGRYQPDRDMIFAVNGSALSKKRTALFLVEPKKLSYLSEFPSTGDTSYPGVVFYKDSVYLSYYTSDLGTDYPWVLGMIKRSDIRMVKISQNKLIEAGKSPLKPYRETPAGYPVFVILLILNILIRVLVKKKKRKKKQKELEISDYFAKH